jgi:hypothetical protein
MSDDNGASDRINEHLKEIQRLIIMEILFPLRGHVQDRSLDDIHESVRDVIQYVGQLLHGYQMQAERPSPAEQKRIDAILRKTNAEMAAMTEEQLDDAIRQMEERERQAQAATD